MTDLSHFDRMISGEPYLDSDPQLVELRGRARSAMIRFNAAGDPAAETLILRDLLGSVGEDVQVVPRMHCDYGLNITLGDRTFINCDSVFLDCAPITLGADCKIGPRVQFLTAIHPIEDLEARRAGVESALPITVGENVWFGGGVIVCPGVSIGDNSVIGAGSVVTRDIPAGVVAVGNPCRVTREIS